MMDRLVFEVYHWSLCRMPDWFVDEGYDKLPIYVVIDSAGKYRTAIIPEGEGCGMKKVARLEDWYVEESGV